MKMNELLKLDERLSSRLKIIDTDHMLKPMAVLFAHSGDSWFWFIGLVVLYFTGSSPWKYRALVMVAGVVLLAVLVIIIKFTVRRRRPEGDWGQIYRATDPHSFPSGHAARAFMLAVLALGLGPAWLGITLIIWAPLVSLARVGTGLHYLSDIFAGMLVGAAAGGLVLLVLPYFNPLIDVIVKAI